MKTHKKRHRSAQSLTFALALAFFTLSVIARLISGGLQLLTNIKTHQSIITNKQQLLAQEAARNVSSYVKEQFSVLETGN